jgi:nitrate/nitrite-specific signal transduction histidine kinase
MHLQTRWGGLRTKIIAWFLFPTTIILSLVALFTFNTYQRVTEDLVIERNQEVTTLLASQLAVELEGYIHQLDVLAATADVYQLRPDPLTRQTILRFSSGTLSDFDAGVLILDESGRVTAADQRRLDVLGQDWSDREYFRRARQAPGSTPQPVFSDVVTDGPEGTAIIVAAVPGTDFQNEFTGLSVGLVHLAVATETRRSPFYVNVFRKLRDTGGDEVYLVDGNGLAIYHSDTRRIGENLAELEAVQKVLSGEAGGLRTLGSGGQEIVASFAPVPGTTWGLVTEERWEDLIGTSQRYSKQLLLLLGAGVLVPALVIAVGATRVTRPIVDLIGAAQNVAEGNFDQLITVTTGDELEALAGQFNRMSAELQKSYATLEQRVAYRTRELAALNSIASVVSRSLELDEILRDALDKTLEVTEMDVGAAYRLEKDGEHLALIASRKLSDPFVRHITRLPLWASAAGPATQAQRPIVMQVSEYPASVLKRLLTEEGLQMAVSIPLIAKGEVLGAINLGSRTERLVGEEELSLLAAIGQQIGVAVENARLYEQAEETAVTAERHRLARDLHDAVTQTLFSASMIAEVLPRIWERNPDEGKRRVEELHQLTRGALAEMRTLLVELRPSSLVEASMGDLLRQLGEAFTGRARVPVTLEIERSCPLPPDVQVAIYRVAQEALNNVFKHANASQVAISLRCLLRDPSSEGGAIPGKAGGAAARVELRIRDDGRGFDPAAIPPDHFGLGIMRERAEAVNAHVTVDSEVGRGTEIVVVWPVE